MDFDSIIHQYQASYFKLPTSVKTFLGSLYGSIPLRFRFGRQYIVHQKILESFNNATAQEQLDFQFNKTYETLQFASDHIPYYQKLFREHGFKVEDFKDFSDLKRIPFLTKQIIKENIDSLYTDVFDKPVPYYTGGSSEDPMRMYAPLSISRAKEKVYMNYTFAQAGHRYRERAVSLSARGNANEEKGVFWEYQKVDNYLLVSVNHLDTAYIGKIVEAVKRWKPKTFYGYPSAISLFIRGCKSIGIERIEGVSGVVLTSESVSWEDVELFKAFFQATVISHYGHTERVVSAWRKDRENYNFFNSYGLVTHNHDEIIGTSFDNFVMPYINYSTQDYFGDKEYYSGTDIVKSSSSIQGRKQESIVTKDKKVIPILSIGAGHFSSYDAVQKAQFYQDTPGQVVLRIVSDSPEQIDTEQMIREMQERVKNKIDFSIEFVDQIENTSRRKHILAVQKLDIEAYLANSDNIQ